MMYSEFRCFSFVCKLKRGFNTSVGEERASFSAIRCYS